MLDDKPVKIISGAIHYFRIPQSQWEDSLYNLKALGANTVETYIPWNIHEPEEGVFNFETKESVLPHKTVAQLSGLGWIGKNNLFITPEYGAAQCLGTVLTDAPLETVPYAPISPKCGNCNICRDICERKVLKGTTWNTAISRDDIIDVYGCSTCLKCLVHCPWTQKYVNFKSRFLQP